MKSDSYEFKSPIFKEIEKIKDISALSQADRMKYDGLIKEYRDTLCVMNYAHDKGYAQGLYESLALPWAKAYAMLNDKTYKKRFNEDVSEKIKQQYQQAILEAVDMMKEEVVGADIISYYSKLAIDERPEVEV